MNMNIFKKIFFLLVILNLSSVQAKAVPSSFADLAEKLMPSVVNISTTQTVKTTTNQFPFQFPPGSPFGEMFKDFENRWTMEDEIISNEEANYMEVDDEIAAEINQLMDAYEKKDEFHNAQNCQAKVKVQLKVKSQS